MSAPLVLVDTSAWIRVFRGETKGLSDVLEKLILANTAAFCPQTYAEYLGGFKKQTLFQELTRQVESFPFLDTTLEAARTAARLMSHVKGLGSGDALIAATAMVHQAELLTFDHGFAPLSRYGLVFHEASRLQRA